MARRRVRFAAEVFHRLWKFLVAFASVDIGAAVAFYFLQPGTNLPTAFYWAIVTLSTTGYGDVVPQGLAARSLTMGILYVQIFFVVFLISVIGTVFNEENQRRLLGVLGTDFRNHIVVLGYGPIGRAAVRELLIQKQRVAVVVEEMTDVANVRTLAPERDLFVTYGRPAEVEILKRVNVPAAHSMIACTEDDTENLIASLNARSLSKALRIVVSVQRPEIRETLRSAGVTYVASPADFGGRMCAAAAFEPDVALAIDQITTADIYADMAEYVLGPRCPIPGGRLGEVERKVRDATGCLVVGYGRSDREGEREPVLNPPPETELRVGDALLVLGTIANISRFHSWFGAEQGR